MQNADFSKIEVFFFKMLENSAFLLYNRRVTISAMMREVAAKAGFSAEYVRLQTGRQSTLRSVHREFFRLFRRKFSPAHGHETGLYYGRVETPGTVFGIFVSYQSKEV